MRKAPSPFPLLLCWCFIITISSQAICQRTVTQEAAIFKNVRYGVFTVLGDAGYGSGFLIDSAGLVLTNHHIVANPFYVRVQINDSTMIAASVVVSDAWKDIAVLLVNPLRIQGLPVLRIAPVRDEIAFEGERVIAVGCPWNKPRIFTSGIISKVEKSVIISDVNINRENSGGPLINMDGEIIAMNISGDFTRPGLPVISGSTSIWLAAPLIDKARRKLPRTTLPSADLLPTMPKRAYPHQAMEAVARETALNEEPYTLKKTGNFDVHFQTPNYIYGKERATELAIATTKKARAEAGRARTEESYNPFRDLKEWAQYEGHYSPTVLLTVIPRIGETEGSVGGRILGGVLALTSNTFVKGSRIYEFKANLKDMQLFVNGSPTSEIRRGLMFLPLNLFRADFWNTYSGADLVQAGQFVFPAEYFRYSGGFWPEVGLAIINADKGKDTVRVEFSRENLEQINLDFEPYWELIEGQAIEPTAFAKVGDPVSDNALQVGMTLEAFEALMPQEEPTRFYVEEFGSATGRTWNGLILKYVSKKRDERYEKLYRFLTNTYVFSLEGEHPRLSHWKEEISNRGSVQWRRGRLSDWKEQEWTRYIY